jgi:hypothetical protein
MITEEIFLQQMALLADRIGRPLAGPTQREYHRQLTAALTTEQFVAAATLAFNRWGGEYRNWPSPQQIIDLVAPVAKTSLTASEAFEYVLAATNDPRVSIDEQRAKVQQFGAATLRAFYAAGGMRDFRNVLESDVPWLRRRFVEVYDAAVDNEHAKHAATLALADAEARVAALITSVASQRTLPAGPVHGSRRDLISQRIEHGAADGHR